MFWCINLTTYLKHNFSSLLSDQRQVEPVSGIEKLEEDLEFFVHQGRSLFAIILHLLQSFPRTNLIHPVHIISRDIDRILRHQGRTTTPGMINCPTQPRATRLKLRRQPSGGRY